MFGNRFYAAKLIGALAVIALLGVHASRRGRSINPALWRCLAEPERWDGTEVRAAGRAVDVTEGAFTLDTGRVRVMVRDVRGRVDEGAPVVVRGFFRSGGGPHVAMTRFRPTSGESSGRRWIEVVSLIVLLLTLWNFHRRFSVHPEALRVARRD